LTYFFIVFKHCRTNTFKADAVAGIVYVCINLSFLHNNSGRFAVLPGTVYCEILPIIYKFHYAAQLILSIDHIMVFGDT